MGISIGGGGGAAGGGASSAPFSGLLIKRTGDETITVEGNGWPNDEGVVVYDDGSTLAITSLLTFDITTDLDTGSVLASRGYYLYLADGALKASLSNAPATVKATLGASKISDWLLFFRTSTTSDILGFEDSDGYQVKYNFIGGDLLSDGRFVIAGTATSRTSADMTDRMPESPTTVGQVRMYAQVTNAAAKDKVDIYSDASGPLIDSTTDMSRDDLDPYSIDWFIDVPLTETNGSLRYAWRNGTSGRYLDFYALGYRR